jgi:hypothetical protein
MRLYIYKIKEPVEKHKRHTVEWVKSIGGAWHWETREAAEVHMQQFCPITIELPSGSVLLIPFADFRIEARPEGGFAASCEHPSS